MTRGAEILSGAATGFYKVAEIVGGAAAKLYKGAVIVGGEAVKIFSAFSASASLNIDTGVGLATGSISADGMLTLNVHNGSDSSGSRTFTLTITLDDPVIPSNMPAPTKALQLNFDPSVSAEDILTTTAYIYVNNTSLYDYRTTIGDGETTASFGSSLDQSTPVTSLKFVLTVSFGKWSDTNNPTYNLIVPSGGILIYGEPISDFTAT